MSKPERDAYALAYAAGKEVTVTDGAGVWRLHQVVRVSHSPHGPFQYLSNLRFRKPGDGLSRALYCKIRYSEITEDGLRTAIRHAVGAAPSQGVLEAFLAYIRRLVQAWQQADAYYKTRDKDKAAARLQDLIAKAVDRVARGEEVSESRAHSKWGRPAFDVYLTSQEREIAREAQKELNGSAHEVPDGVPLREHLADFKKRLAAACLEKSAQSKTERLARRRQRLLDLLETDVELRRLVSLALDAAREARGGGLAYELPHRLFGYTHDENTYSELLPQLADMIKPYGLETSELSELVSAGSEYLAGGGMLPVSVASFSRQEGEFAHGDRIVVNGRAEKVMKVGTLYVYGPRGEQWEKTAVKLRPE